MRKKPIPKTQTWWRKKCVFIAKRLAKERDNYTCQKCGKKPDKIDGSHVYPEGTYHGMSAEVDNIKALCSFCHLYWWHKNPLEARDWFEMKFPDRYNRLKQMSRLIIKKDWKEEFEKLNKQYGQDNK